MYCRECLEREQCVTACAALEAHLKEIEVGERERVLEPRVLELVADRVLFTWADLLPEPTERSGRLVAGMRKLPPELLRTFILHLYDGMTVTELARSQRLHRNTVSRRLAAAVRLIAAELRKDGLDIADDRPATAVSDAPRLGGEGGRVVDSVGGA
jgi:DNA-directed RNA polymerase specialized sigma24 family protein